MSKTKVLLTTVCVCAFLLLATSAEAWKPATHVYLSKIAWQDAIDGRVTIQVIDKKGEFHTLGNYPVRKDLLAAYKASPSSYYLGVLGPDAFPDFITGQMIIHPRTAYPIKDTSTGKLSLDGTDAWLTHLWNRMRNKTWKNNKSVQAFVHGYLNHATGDLFAHTLVNHFAGGEFAVGINMARHIALEGYVYQRMPSVKPMMPKKERPKLTKSLRKFIYEVLIRTHGHSDHPKELMRTDRLNGSSTRFASLPWFFNRMRMQLMSKIRKHEYDEKHTSGGNILAVAIDKLDDKIDGIDYWTYQYRKAWVLDIDRGLKAWPQTAMKLSDALVFSEFTPESKKGVAGAKAAFKSFRRNHLLSMLGTPDAIAKTLKIAGKTKDKFIKFAKKILPAELTEAYGKFKDEIKNAMLGWFLDKAFNLTLKEFNEMVHSKGYLMGKVFPKKLWDRYGAKPKACKEDSAVARLNYNILDIKDCDWKGSATWDWHHVAPTFNTVQLTKMSFLHRKDFNKMLQDLKGFIMKEHGVTAVRTNDLKRPNVMLGYIHSLDRSRQYCAGPQGKNSQWCDRKCPPSSKGGARFATSKRVFQSLFLDHAGSTKSKKDSYDECNYGDDRKWKRSAKKGKYQKKIDELGKKKSKKKSKGTVKKAKNKTKKAVKKASGTAKKAIRKAKCQAACNKKKTRKKRRKCKKKCK